MASHEWTECVFEPRPGELLDQVVLLVRQPGRAEHPHVLRGMALHHPLEPVGGDLERVLPGRRLQLSVLTADERLGQAVRMVDEVEREAALDAEVALVRDVLGLRGHLDDPLRLGVDVQVELAADAAERARRLHLLERPLLDARALEELLVDRAGRAGGEATAAELALRVEPAAAPGRDDPRLRARDPRARARSTASPPACNGHSGCRGCTCRARSPSAGSGRRTAPASRRGARTAPRRRAPRRGRSARSADRRDRRSGARRGASRSASSAAAARSSSSRPPCPLADAGRARRQRPWRALDVDDAHPAAAVRRRACRRGRASG